MEQKLLLGKTIVGKVTAYQLQELVNATIETVHSLDEIIAHLMDKIPRYQKRRPPPIRQLSPTSIH